MHPTEKHRTLLSALPADSPAPAIDPSSREILERLNDAESLIADWNQSATPLQPPTLSVIIPAFNEIDTLQEVVDAVLQLPLRMQIIVVDDGSTDGTRELIAKLDGSQGVEACFHPINRGKGAAIQSGMERAIGDVVIVQDADLEYNPQDILRVIQPILDGAYDVVYGSRYLGNPHQDGSWIHRFGNKVLTELSNFVSGYRLSDMETCYKAFRREIIQGIKIEQQRFGFEPEITSKLSRQRVPILEVPIQYKPRSWREGKKIGFRDLINALWCIVRYRFS